MVISHSKLLVITRGYLPWYHKAAHLIPNAVIAAQQLIPVFTSLSREQRSASQMRSSPAASPGDAGDAETKRGAPVILT